MISQSWPPSHPNQGSFTGAVELLPSCRPKVLLGEAGCGEQIGMHVYLFQLHYVQCTCLFSTYIQGLSRAPGSLDIATHSINIPTPCLDDQIFWRQQSKQEEGSLSWYRAPSVDVELTSSILMAHLTKSSLSSDDIKKASQIVSWLTKQQNPYGGFASTQVIPLGHHHQI